MLPSTPPDPWRQAAAARASHPFIVHEHGVASIITDFIGWNVWAFFHSSVSLVYQVVDSKPTQVVAAATFLVLKCCAELISDQCNLITAGVF